MPDRQVESGRRAPFLICCMQNFLGLTQGRGKDVPGVHIGRSYASDMVAKEQLCFWAEAALPTPRERCALEVCTVVYSMVPSL